MSNSARSATRATLGCCSPEKLCPEGRRLRAEANKLAKFHGVTRNNKDLRYSEAVKAWDAHWLEAQGVR